MLAIAIISLLGFITNLFTEEKVNLGYATIATIAWWTVCFPLAIIIMALTGIITLIGLVNY